MTPLFEFKHIKRKGKRERERRTSTIRIKRRERKRRQGERDCGCISDDIIVKGLEVFFFPFLQNI